MLQSKVYLHLLDNEVKIVPARVGKQAGVEGERYHGNVCLGVLECEEFCLAVPELDNAGDGDEDESKHLGVSEIVLDLKHTICTLSQSPFSPPLTMAAHLTLKQLMKQRRQRQAAARILTESEGGSHSGKKGLRM